jgi:tRNA A-37 threonylcarbamoyl transferase component Bud32
MTTVNRDALEHQLQSAPELRGRLRIGLSIIDKHNRSVFDAALDGKAVVVKHYRSENAQHRVTKEANATEVRANLLGTAGPARAPQLLFTRPDLGVFILEKVEGTAGNMFLDPEGPPMPYLFPSAALWLSECIKVSHETNALAVNYWQSVLTRPPEIDLQTSQQRDLFTAIASKTLQYLTNAAGPVTKTIGHGDFQPNNLIINDNVTYGIDFQSNSVTPAAREIAHFLVRSNALCNTAGTHFGFDTDLITPFYNALSEDEISRLLPLFLGVSLLADFKNDQRWRAQTVQRRYDLAERFLKS